jgi:hypothetical protein
MSLTLYDLEQQADSVITIANNTSSILTGSQADRPATTRSGILYVPTDGGYESVFDGSSWSTYVDGYKCGKPPVLSTMSGINLSSITSFTAISDTWVVTQSGIGSGSEWSAGYVTALPSPPYRFEVGIEPIYVWHSSWSYFGISLSNGITVSSPILTFHSAYGSSGYNTLIGGKYNHCTSWNSGYFQAVYNTPPYNKSRIFFRFRDNGVTRFYEGSTDGVNWSPFYSVGRTDFTTPTHAGVFAGQSTNTRATTDKRVQFKVFHWYLGV